LCVAVPCQYGRRAGWAAAAASVSGCPSPDGGELDQGARQGPPGGRWSSLPQVAVGVLGGVGVAGGGLAEGAIGGGGQEFGAAEGTGGPLVGLPNLQRCSTSGWDGAGGVGAYLRDKSARRELQRQADRERQPLSQGVTELSSAVQRRRQRRVRAGRA
jgi:hypothetical protein